MVTVSVLFLLLSALFPLSHSQFSEKWSNRDPVKYRNMTQDCGTPGFCAAMKANGEWEAIKCTNTRNFMCYKQDSSPIINYHLILETKTWYEAQCYCRQKYNDLVSIKEQVQNDMVKNEGLNSTTPFWIGLLCHDQQRTDGGTSTNTLSASIHVSDVAMSWEKALDYCQEQNRTGLLQIDSKDDQAEVEKELKRGCVSEPVWVGLRQSQLFGFWIWPNGNAVFPYNNWDEGKQPEHQVSHHCGAVVPEKNYKWTDMNCEAEYKALCHIRCST
ncbi:secretory phospholipase A2 receptor-like [Tachysurus ichikawai]